MKHLGDITLIHGNEIEPVDCIIGGSPCQDLSVAGKRAGLSGERSGLFMEQIRIVKEMRKRYGKPRYMVWENVPGAFSSNNGEDFRAVLEEVTKIADETAVIPRPPKGKWSYAGCVMGDGWSVAWRTHDAQFWGVPQRRRRIALVADFGGESAPKILFERESVSRDSQESGETREGTTGNVAYCIGNAISFQERAGCPGGGKGILIQNERTGALSTLNNQSVCYGISSYDSNSMKSANPHSRCREVEVSKILDTTNPNPNKNQGGIAIVEVKSTSDEQTLFQPKSLCEENWSESDVKNALRAGESKSSHVIVQQSAGFCPEQNEKTRSIGYEEEVTPTLRAGATPGIVCKCYDARSNRDGKTAPTLTGDHQNRVTDYTALTFQNTRRGWWNESPVGATIRTPSGGDSTLANIVCAVDCRNGTENPDTNGTLQAKSNGGMSLNLQNVVREYSIVRRLTPLEYERLQGYPDGWTDIGDWTDSKGKKHKSADAPRYKALGNSIALPFWFWMLRRMSEYLPTGATMGSLFDGIGGFPLCWETIHGKGSARWASEIEEFPIAVTKLRFPEKG